MDDRKYIGKAKLTPASKFVRPMDVVAARGLAAAEKLAILKTWEADERALQRAEGEGMGGGEHAHLHRVREALMCLEEEALLDHSKEIPDAEGRLVPRGQDPRRTRASHPDIG